MFSGWPDESVGELIYTPQDAWVAVSTGDISAIIVSGACSVTVRDVNANVLGQYSEGTYLCCGGDPDGTRIPNAHILTTGNDNIHSVYIGECKMVFIFFSLFVVSVHCR